MTVTLNPSPPTQIDTAVRCIVPVSDMLNCCLFDTTLFKKENFVTADDPHDSIVLARYSPNCHVHAGIAYSVRMIVSGDERHELQPNACG